MRLRSAVASVIAFVLLVPAAAGAGPVAPLDAAAGCDPIDPTYCLLPLPNDHFTVDDPDTVTGKRININPLATPRALQGVKPIFTDELNRNDGWSPGSMLLTFVPGLDLHQTWDTTAMPTENRDHLTNLSRYLIDDAPMVIINTETGQRHPFWSELDTHPNTGDDERMLIIRPAVNFDEATRYVVGLRNLKDATGTTIPAGPGFEAYLAGEGGDPQRQAEISSIIDEIEDAEVARGNDFDRDELYLAWDFTIASWQNLAGRALHMRDTAFASLGDTDLANLTVEGSAPAFQIDRVVEDDETFVHGSITVPNFLVGHVATDDIYDPTGQVTDEQLSPLHSPHARLFYPPGSELPEVNPILPTLQAKFTCRIPSTATAADPARLILMGHGLLGQRYEVGWNSGNLLTREHNSMYCGTEWTGMSFGDIPQAVSILLDPSFFPSLADRAQQGYLHFMFLGRAMLHPDGFAGDPLFQDVNGEPLIDTSRLVYDGNSQGGIMGGALAALAPDFTRATLGVLGMNYSTLLNRSVDWEGSYGDIYYASIPDKREQQIGIHLIQMLWDRAEANGFAHHMTDDPYPNTPPHQILLHAAYADYQVANVSAEVEARTIGARFLQTSMPNDRHWSVDASWGMDTFDVVDGEVQPWNGSALVYWDSGNPVPPNGNIPPESLGKDPHEHPRRDIESGLQRVAFFDTGWIHDMGPGAYCSNEFPVHPDQLSVCPNA